MLRWSRHSLWSRRLVLVLLLLLLLHQQPASLLLLLLLLLLHAPSDYVSPNALRRYTHKVSWHGWLRRKWRGCSCSWCGCTKTVTIRL